MSFNLGKKDVNKKNTKTFELVVQLKNNKGKNTGHIKSIATNDSSKLSDFWSRYGNPKVKRKKKVRAAITTKEIDTAVKEANEYAEKINVNKQGVSIND